MAALGTIGRFDAASRNPGHLDGAGAFGELSRRSLVADATQRVAASADPTPGTAIRVARYVARSLPLHPVALAGLGGAVLGVIDVAFPLTLASGKEQLTATIQDAQALGVALLIGARWPRSSR